jgi:hypothetical protein
MEQDILHVIHSKGNRVLFSTRLSLASGKSPALPCLTSPPSHPLSVVKCKWWPCLVCIFCPVSGSPFLYSPPTGSPCVSNSVLFYFCRWMDVEPNVQYSFLARSFLPLCYATLHDWHFWFFCNFSLYCYFTIFFIFFRFRIFVVDNDFCNKGLWNERILSQLSCSRLTRALNVLQPIIC